jgi:hypothetical protein
MFNGLGAKSRSQGARKMDSHDLHVNSSYFVRKRLISAMNIEDFFVMTETNEKL